jgi:hypothetical protein
MRLSLQTACIIFGVTLAHVFVISALSPVALEGETTSESSVPRPRIVLDPELESLLEADAGNLAGDAAGVVIEDEPAETPAHPLSGGETGAAPAPPAESDSLPAPNLAGNGGRPAPTPNEPAALEPAPAIREIRAIAPVPRS